MRIPIVNEQDEIIGVKERKEVTLEDIYRIASLWVTDTEGNILLARRAFDKAHDPGKWGPAVAGTVEEGETYEDNIIKEAEEELGLKNVKLQMGVKTRSESSWRYFAQEFLLTLPKGFNDFKIEKKEVAEVKWFSVAELKNLIKENPDEFLKGVKRRMENYETKS
jgi:isopentenyl-diphosphate delta-isomerase